MQKSLHLQTTLQIDVIPSAHSATMQQSHVDRVQRDTVPHSAVFHIQTVPPTAVRVRAPSP
jgi:hypothetical protein